MAGNKIEKADKAVAKAATPLRDTTAVKVLGWLSEVADQPQLITLSAGLLASGLVSGEARLARSGARMLGSVLVATKLKSFIKHRVDRTRPHVVADGGSYEMHGGDSHATALNSFPSGHTAGAVAVARAIARENPEYRAAAYLAAGTVAAIQIPRCKHYISDLAVGAVIGAVGEKIVDSAVTWIFRKQIEAEKVNLR